MLQKNGSIVIKRSTRSNRAPTPSPLPRRIRLEEMDIDALYALADQLDGSPVPGVVVSEANFVEWCPESLRAEWVDGSVVLMSPSNVEHDDLNTWLTTLLRTFVEDHDAGNIYHDVFVRFADQRRRRVPDLMFVSRERMDLLRPTYLNGPPDLLIEIVSPDSQSRDRREKYLEYEKAGVREYWIVDPLSKMVEVSRLERKKFHRIDESAGIITSSVLRGFRLKTAQLWQKPLPKVSSVLKWMAKR
jgi:Uma2 family endonuclease